MSITLFFICLLTLTNTMDTLHLPVKNGVIIPDNPYVHKSNKSVLIAFKDDVNIHTCLTGKVVAIKKFDLGYYIGIKSDNIEIVYSSLDSLKVELNDLVRQGDVIGSKIKHLDDNYISLAVFISGREVESSDFLIKINSSNCRDGSK